ncbi:MAG: DUF6492 family protein [Cyanobacteria bacterium J06638_22]
MQLDAFDIVIPLYRARWNTQAVLEGLTTHYQPRTIHIVTPTPEVEFVKSASSQWNVAPLTIHAEEPFFQPIGLTKDAICAELDLGESLYTPGWFYQQLLKLGAPEGIPDLSEWYVVWDSDLLPVDTWPLLRKDTENPGHSFALLQSNRWGNPTIVGKWETWIRSVLEVEPLTDPDGTFVPHHMWFKRSHLKSFQQRIGQYYQSDDSWLSLMMRSANDFGTFSEYWAYVSWVAAIAPDDLSFYPYEQYGETTERFFDDGTGLFSTTFRARHRSAVEEGTVFSPSYAELDAFIRAEYGTDPLPSSLSFESSPRHLKKDEATMHIEERRSRWNPRNLSASPS